MRGNAALPALLGGLPVRPEGPPSWPRPDPEVVAALERCARSAGWGQYGGEYGAALRARLAEFHGTEHVVLCSSGTAAVELALRGLAVGPGAEVILAGYDFKGNFLNVVTVGATPVLVDLDPQSGQIAPWRVAAAITPRTRAIVASHLHGGVCDLAALRGIADTHGVALIEDACQMPGAPLGGARAGTRGDVGVLSFGGSKLLSAGRGGALITQRADVVARIQRYTWRGNDAYPLSELQAAVLLPQLERLDAYRTERRTRVAELFARLADVGVVTPLQPLDAPHEPDYYKVGLRYRAAACGGLPRNLFAAAMRAEGIALDPGFRGLHCIHARSRFRQADELQEATRADTDWLVLHHPVLLAGPGALDEIVAALAKIRDHAERLSSGPLPLDPHPSSEEAP